MKVQFVARGNSPAWRPPWRPGRNWTWAFGRATFFLVKAVKNLGRTPIISRFIDISLIFQNFKYISDIVRCIVLLFFGGGPFWRKNVEPTATQKSFFSMAEATLLGLQVETAPGWQALPEDMPPGARHGLEARQTKFSKRNDEFQHVTAKHGSNIKFRNVLK